MRFNPHGGFGASGLSGSFSQDYRGPKSSSLPPIGCVEFEATRTQNHRCQTLWIADTGPTSLDISDDLTVEMWFKPLQTYSGYQYIFEKGDLGKTNYLLNWEDGNLQFHSETPGGSYIAISRSWPTPFSSTILNTWCHIAVTRTRTTGLTQLYFDGVPLGAGSVLQAGSAMRSDGVSNISLGGREHNGYFPAACRVAQLRVWNVARTSAEILANYNKSLGGAGAGLVMDAPLAIDFNDVGPDAHHFGLQPGSGFNIVPEQILDDGPPLIA